MTTHEIREHIAYAQVDLEPEHVQKRFWELIDKGNSPIMALMCASNKAPGVKGGDRVFNEQARHRMETMHPRNRERILEIAKKAGINTQGKYYVGGLGRYNDPAAWVSTTDDVMASAKKKGCIVNGAVRYDPGEDERFESQCRTAENIRIAPDLVDEIAGEYIQKDEKIREKVRKDPKKLAEVKEMVIEKHGKKKR